MRLLSHPFTGGGLSRLLPQFQPQHQKSLPSAAFFFLKKTGLWLLPLKINFMGTNPPVQFFCHVSNVKPRLTHLVSLLEALQPQLLQHEPSAPFPSFIFEVPWIMIRRAEFEDFWIMTRRAEFAAH